MTPCSRLKLNGLHGIIIPEDDTLRMHLFPMCATCPAHFPLASFLFW
jgi:hypothetical protein